MPRQGVLGPGPPCCLDMPASFRLWLVVIAPCLEIDPKSTPPMCRLHFFQMVDAKSACVCVCVYLRVLFPCVYPMPLTISRSSGESLPSPPHTPHSYLNLAMISQTELGSWGCPAALSEGEAHWDLPHSHSSPSARGAEVHTPRTKLHPFWGECVFLPLCFPLPLHHTLMLLLQK